MEDYPELGVGGKASRTIQGHDAGKKMLMKFRLEALNDSRKLNDIPEEELVNEKHFKQIGHWMVHDLTMLNKEEYSKSTLEVRMTQIKTVILNLYPSNILWANKAPWYTILLKSLAGSISAKYNAHGRIIAERSDGIPLSTFSLMNEIILAKDTPACHVDRYK